MTHIRTPSAAVNGDATPSRQKFRLLDRIHGDHRLSRADVFVAHFIISWFNPARGCAWPSLETLAERTNMDVRAVKRSVARLVAFGVINIKTRGRRGHASEYTLNWDYGDSAVTETGNKVTALSGYGDSAVPHTVTALPPHTPSSRSESVGMMGADAGRSPPDGGRARAGEAASDVFEAWWAEYPRKEGRAAARKVFDAVLSRGDVSVAVLVSKARQYATAKAHIADSKYIKQPANWLKEECWLEDPQPPRAKSERTAKAKGKAEPVVEPDDDDDVEDFLTPEEFAEEAGFPIGTCVWHRPTGYKGEVLGVEENHDVLVRWEKAGDVRHCADDLVFEPPFTPEQMAEMEAERAKSVAEAEAGRKAKRDEAEKKRLAEVERERGRRKLFERFPIGARVDSTDPDYEYLEDGEVVDHSDDAVLVDWGRYEGDTQWAYSAEELVLTRPGARCAS